MDPILVFDGGDHESGTRRPTAACLGYADSPSDDFEVLHTSLDAYLAEVLPQAERIQTVVQGELREPGTDCDDEQWLIPGVLSSRVWIKQANAELRDAALPVGRAVQRLGHLSLRVEPRRAFSTWPGSWLLQNHPHDSICGCSIDSVHEDMEYRFSQSRQIGDRLTLRGARAASPPASTALSDPTSCAWWSSTPLPQPLDEPVELTLQIPTDWPTFNEFFGFEPKPAFRIYDAAGPGGAVPAPGTSAMNRRKVRILRGQVPRRVSHPRRDGRACRCALPGAGLHHPDRARRTQRPGHAPSDRAGSGHGGNSMENEHLRVTVEANGTLTVTDKRTGETYHRLLTFEDCADIGDGWYHGQAVNDQVFVSTASARRPWRWCTTARRLATFRVRTTMEVPAELHFDNRMQPLRPSW